MPAFACRTRDAAGEVVEKTVSAGSRREALALLERDGLAPVRVQEVAGNTPAAPGAAKQVRDAASGRSPGSAVGRKVPRKALMNFSLQLSSSLGAGIPILAGLQAIRIQTRSDALRDVLTAIIIDLEGGESLSAAMRKYPKAFPFAYVGTIQAGEASGTLDQMLDNVADYLEAEMEARADVRSAVLYPAIVISTLGIAITILVVFIVPRFAAFYSGFDAELPLATRILIGGSAFMSSYFIPLLVASGGLVFGAMRLLRVRAVRRWVDGAAMRIPYLGRLIETAVTLHAVQLLGLFTGAGVPVLEGIQTAADTATNTKYRENLSAVAAGISVGRTMADGLEQTQCFPAGARHMLASGEATGTLERACLAVARQYKKELRYMTKNVATVIEPLLTLVLAGVVLFVALAAFLPMWDLVKVIGK
jgi:type II secretory pathway component PulF